MTKAADTATPPPPPRRSTGLKSFGADIRPMVAPLLGKRGVMQADILARWEDILGSALATGVRPSSVSFSKSGDDVRAILKVKAFSGAYAFEFEMQKQQILSKINTYFGYQAIVDIRITQGTFVPKLPNTPAFSFTPEQHKAAEALTADIQDDTLRQTMTEIGLYLGNRKK